MDREFYKKLQEKNKIEPSIIHLTYNIFKNEKIHIVVIPILLNIILSIGTILVMDSYPNTLEIFTNLLTDSFTFSVGITSFLIAASTIFFTMIKSEVTYAFLLIHEEGYEQNKLKTTIYNFIKPIIYFCFLIVYNFLFKIFSGYFIRICYIESVYNFFKVVSMYFFFYLLYASIMELFFLIYNIYSFVMLINLDNVARKQLKATGVKYEDYIEFKEKEFEQKLNEDKYSNDN